MNTTATGSAASAKLIVTVDDAAMLNKVKNTIKMPRGVGGISVVSPKKTDMELAREDIDAGRITEWNSVDELFHTVIGK